MVVANIPHILINLRMGLKCPKWPACVLSGDNLCGCLAQKCPFSGSMSLLIASGQKHLTDRAHVLLPWGGAGGRQPDSLSWEIKPVTDRRSLWSWFIVMVESRKKFPPLFLLTCQILSGSCPHPSPPLFLWFHLLWLSLSEMISGACKWEKPSQSPTQGFQWKWPTVPLTLPHTGRTCAGGHWGSRKLCRVVSQWPFQLVSKARTDLMG